MFRVYKAGNINLREPKQIKHMDMRLVKKPKKDNSMSLTNNSTKNEIEAQNIVEAAKELYANIIEEANAESMKIFKNAKEEIQATKKEEYEKAYQEGFEKGYYEGKAQAESIIVQAEEVKTFLERRKEELLQEAEQDIIQMVLDISKKVIGQELKQSKDVIISLIKQALEKCAYKNEISIKVSSEDYKYVIENKSLIESLIEGVSEIDVIEDKYLKKGDCVIDTPGGQVDSSAELQMKELEQAFLFVLRNE